MRVYDLKGTRSALSRCRDRADRERDPHVGDDVLVRSQSYTHPRRVPLWLRQRRASGDGARSGLPADFSDCEVRREFATAPDGMKLPINIIMRKGTSSTAGADGSLRYGSYGLSEQPYFQPGLKVWLEQGGIYADASIRGAVNTETRGTRPRGSERRRYRWRISPPCALPRGEGLHEQGRLAIEGGSAGGLLVYGTLIQPLVQLGRPRRLPGDGGCMKPGLHVDQGAVDQEPAALPPSIASRSLLV